MIFLVSLISAKRGKELLAQSLDPSAREDIMILTLDYINKKNTSVSREQAIASAMQKEEIDNDMNKIDSTSSDALKSFASSFHFYFDEQMLSDNNVDNTKRRKASIINTITPGVRFNQRDANKTITSDLHATQVVYNNRSSADNTFGGASATLNYRLGKGIFTMADTYSNNFEPEEQLTGAQISTNADENISNSSDLLRNWKNSFVVGYGRLFRRFGFDTDYTRTDYEEWKGNQNYFEDTFDFNPYFRLSKKSQILGEYSFSRKRYPDDNVAPKDSIVNNAGIGFTSAITPKTSILLKGNFENHSIENSDSYEKYIFVGKLGHKATKRSDMALEYNYIIYDPITRSSYYTENSLELSGGHRLAINPKIRLIYALKADYKYLPKLEGSPNSQLDRTYRFKLGSEYILNTWLNFSLTWEHLLFQSNISDDYYKDLITFKTQAKF